MLLETLKEENNGALAGDDLMKTLNEIARKSASERPLDSVTNKSSIGKTEKDELNTKERRSSRIIPFTEKEALQCRANSLKRAVHNVIQHSEMLKPYDKRYSMQVMDNLCVYTSSSSETSPWSAPVPPINIISPSVSTNHLTCISPLDLRRDSMDEYFFNDLSLPVPRQFADGSSRRSSEVIKEETDNGDANDDNATVDPLNVFPFCKDNKKSESKATNNINVDYDSKDSLCRLEYLKYSNEQREDGFGFIPFEVYERNKLRNQQTLNELATTTASKTTSSNNMLQVPTVMLPSLEIERPPPKHENVYVSDTITLIDTDPPVWSL